MNIVLVTSSYFPEIRSSSHLMQELAEELRDRRHNITVVTSYPTYNLTEYLKDKVFDEFSIENGISIVRVKTLHHYKVNFIRRGISQLTMPYLFISKIKRYIKDKVDVVIIYSPPLPLAKVGKAVKHVYGAKFILNVQDIFPQNAIDIGVLKNKILIGLFESLEKKAYKNADSITVHSEGNRDVLVKNNRAHQEKIYILHNWIDINNFVSLKRTNIFRRKYSIEDKFIFLFAGVIGPSQGLELIVEVAKQLETLSDICFLIVGDGMEKKRLENMVENFKLKNVIFKPFVSKDEYPLLVKDADIGLVCLTSMNKTPIVPSKILGYMAASIPVVAFLNKESDGHQIIREANCGYSEVSDNLEKAVEIINKIYNERNDRSRLKEYGENGFNYARENFEKNVCINYLEKLF